MSRRAIFTSDLFDFAAASRQGREDERPGGLTPNLSSGVVNGRSMVHVNHPYDEFAVVDGVDHAVVADTMPAPIRLGYQGLSICRITDFRSAEALASQLPEGGRI